jgi:hypothetical protein
MMDNISDNVIKSVRGRIHRSANGQVFKSNIYAKRNLDVGSAIVNSPKAQLVPGSPYLNLADNSLTRMLKRQDPVTNHDEQTTKSKSEPTSNASTSNENRDSTTTGESKSTSTSTADTNTLQSKDQVHAP